MIGFLFIGIIAGWLAGHIMQGGGFGLFGDLIVGVAGSFIGGYLFKQLGLKTNGTIGSIITAVVGAVVLLAIIRLIH